MNRENGTSSCSSSSVKLDVIDAIGLRPFLTFSVNYLARRSGHITVGQWKDSFSLTLEVNGGFSK